MSVRCRATVRAVSFARAVGALSLAVFATVVMTAEARVARAEETCVECHRNQRNPRLRAPAEDVPVSVHGRHDVTCSNCHGGNPEEPSARAHDVAAGFRARFAAGSAPSVCGGCHSHTANMGADGANLPTDQLELYVASVHGRAFAGGNERAATCATCHGAHNVRELSDPESPVSPSNVAETCGRCHSDRPLMTSLGMPHDEERQWRHSVHGRAYARWLAKPRTGPLPRTERHPPTCNDCHDDHAVAGREAAVSGCQRCHTDMWDSFSEGPHRAAFQRMGFMPCVDCHGSHEIAPANASLIGIDREAACRRCHSEGQEMFDAIRRLGVQVRTAERAADRARRGLGGQPVGSFESKLRPIEEAQHALRLAVHTLDRDRIAAAATVLKTRADRVTPQPEAPSTVIATVANWAPTTTLIVVGALFLLFAFFRRGGKK